MTNPTIALLDYLHKVGMDQDKDFLQESVRVMSQMVMDLEAQQRTGADLNLTPKNGHIVKQIDYGTLPHTHWATNTPATSAT